MPITNTTRNTVIAGRVFIASTFLSRAAGLLSKASLPDGEALIITNCNSIHMFFMKFPIDAIFADRDYRVVGLTENIKPFHLSRIFWKASFVVELPAGTICISQTKIGDVLKIDGFKSGI